MDEVIQDFGHLTRQSGMAPEGSRLDQMPPGQLQDRQIGRVGSGYPAQVRWSRKGKG